MLTAIAYNTSEHVVQQMRAYQSDFVAGDTRFVSIVGAKGSSKTWCGARFVIAELDRQPNSQGLLMWNTLQQARDIYFQDIEPLFKQLKIPYRFNQSTLTINVLGSVIHLRSAEPDVIKRIESVAYSWGWADEASYYSTDALTTFVSRVRKGEARVRVTSMPDEPDAYIYKFLEDQGGMLYEISLKDNPDKAFRDRYETLLRATYDGAQLDRFLHGRRVSLTGLGMFSITPEHKVECEYNADKPLYISWDFNVEYRAVSVWQEQHLNDKAIPVYACIASHQMKEPTVYEDAAKLAELYSSHRSTVVLLGDASGENRTALTTGSMWKAVRDKFNETFGMQMHYKVPLANPAVKDTIQCANWALRNNLVIIHPNERHVYQSLQAAKADKYGDIDKSADYKDGRIKSHDADTARYALWEFYGRMYPGNRNNYWIV